MIGLLLFVSLGYGITGDTFYSGKSDSFEKRVSARGTQETRIALGAWKAEGLSFQVVREGSALYIKEFQYQYVSSCNRCRLAIGKIPLDKVSFRMESKEGQFTISGDFTAMHRVKLHLQSFTKNCTLDRSLEAVPERNSASFPADSRFR